MRKVGSRELKNRMGRYMREVKKGRSLVITERGEQIATISPKAKTDANSGLDDILGHLEKQGLIRKGRGKMSKIRAVKSRGKLASEIIIEDRK